MPCAANASTIAGEPKALNERNCSAGPRIGESCTAYKNGKTSCKQDYKSKTQLYKTKCPGREAKKIFFFFNFMTPKPTKNTYLNFLAVDTIILIANECKGKLYIYIVETDC